MQSVLIQLIHAGPDGIIAPVDLTGVNYLGGDDVLLKQIVFTNRQNNGFSEYAAVSYGTHTEAFMAPFYLYARVYEDATPEAAESYYDSGLLEVSAQPPPATQFFDINKSGVVGDNLTSVIGATSVVVRFDEIVSTGCPRLITRVWTATDRCGVSFAATQRITVLDNEAPHLEAVPPDAMVSCDAVPTPARVVAHDTCALDRGVVDDLLVYYPLDSDQGTRALDLSGHNRTADLHGAQWRSDGWQGGCVQFDGADDYGLVGGIALADHSFTLAAWARPVGSTQACCNSGRQLIFAQGTTGFDVGLQFGYEWNGTFLFGFYNDDLWTTSAVVDAAQWHHWVGTFDTSNLEQRIYRDGALVAQRTAVAYRGTGDLLIARGFGAFANSVFQGSLDEMRVYGRRLSPDEVVQLYTGEEQFLLPATFAETSTTGLCPRVITRTWTATDACGNSVTATQKITVADSTPPVLIGVPGDAVVNCGNVPAPAVVTAIEACGSNPPVYFSVATNGGCPGSIVRIWSASDVCGNAAVATQKITLLDSVLDSDGDGLDDADEIQRGTNPFLADTDGDGRGDGLEVAKGTDPLSKTSFPRYVRHDFDGDLKADVAYYAPASGQWTILQSTGGTRNVTWGGPGGVAAPEDFDGDGKGDLAVYHATAGVWRILGSKAGAYTQVFGYASAAAAPGDFDGDGRADLAVYSANSGKWSIWRTQAGYRSFIFGFGGTVPAVSDYDGDGKADVGLYRYGVDFTWRLLKSKEGYAKIPFGYAGVWPLPADYDGDGRADLAVFSTGNSAKWSIWRSHDGYTSFSFGHKGVLPARGDFDGDGEADPATYDPVTFQWQLRQSQDGLESVTHGAPNVVPIGSTP